VTQDDTAANPVHDALLAAVVFATDPAGLGGLAIKANAGPVRQAYLDFLKKRLPAGAPFRKIPLQIQDERLLGGIDLAATLNSGRPVMQTGLLVEADGGVVVLPMAERTPADLAARLVAVMDAGQVEIQRDGISATRPTRFGVVALDEGIDADECLPAALLDRLAFHISLTQVSHAEMTEAIEAFEFFLDDEPLAVMGARARQMTIGDELVQALCSTAMLLGIQSTRAAIASLRVARVSAAMAGRTEPAQEDAVVAARLVLGPRATMLPAVTPPDDAEQEERPNSAEDEVEDDDKSEDQLDNQRDNQRDNQPNDEPKNNDADDETAELTDQPEPPESELTDPINPEEVTPLEDLVLEAATAAIPAGLLSALSAMAGSPQMQSRAMSSGRAGALQKGGRRGRPMGSRSGMPAGRARLNLIDTLRAAAPWQRLRRASQPGGVSDAPGSDLQQRRVMVRPEDFQITRFKQRAETTTIFVVDASGSAAINRLAEAKGAVELLLADCYVRRDQGAVIAFRGKVSEVILPPTRSLVRAKRSLSGLPGGGGTPLVLGIESAAVLALGAARRGETPVIVMLTDARANVDRDGNPGRERAQEQAVLAARQIRAAGFMALLIDTSPQPSALAQDIAAEMRARYLPLPYAGAAQVSQAVKLMTTK
jgi:magnesium chelatase subunit D